MTRDRHPPTKLVLISSREAQSLSIDAVNDLDGARRARDAIAVALALLDDLLSLPAGASDAAVSTDVVNIFQEIEEIAKAGAAQAV